MGGGCTTPIGAHIEIEQEFVRMWGMIATDDGSDMTLQSARFAKEIAMRDVPVFAAQLTREMAKTRNHRAESAIGWEPDKHPLKGKAVLVTGSDRLIERLADTFAGESALVTRAPTLEILPTSTPRELTMALEKAANGVFDWLIVTSQQTVSALATFGPERLAGVARIAAVGGSTARAIREVGLVVDLVPDVQTGEGLVEAFARIGLKGDRVLCLLGSSAGDIVTDGLAALGAIVTRIESYQSRAIDHMHDEIRQVVRAGRIDLVVFSSPLSVQTLTNQLGADLGALSGACLAAIGTTTQSAMLGAGLPVHVVSPEPTPARVVEASRDYFQRRIGLEAKTDG
jgi:uroporphyrinogen-III synthase